MTAGAADPDFEPIVLTSADEGELEVVAELVEVLGRELNQGTERCNSE